MSSSDILEIPKASATAKFLNISASKVRRVINVIRGKQVAVAKEILTFLPQEAATPVLKLLNSAIANAENNQQLDSRTLVVETIYANEGPTMKRIKPGSHGKAFRIRKRTCHLTITLANLSKANKVVRTSQRKEA